MGIIKYFRLLSLRLQNYIWSVCFYILSRSISDYRRGLGLVIGFIDHLCTQLGTTSNCSSIAILHNLQIITAQAKYYPTSCVFSSHSLVRTSNSGDSSASAVKSSLNGASFITESFLHRLPYRTMLVVPVVFLISPRHGSCSQHLSFSYALPPERVCRIFP
jgi:hypothetical protein